MRLRRRSFLQRLSLALAALGISDTAAAGWAGCYQQVLAQPARRKLALLVGIDQYPSAAIDPALPPGAAQLYGAVTDVELQRELLLYRFGFEPGDIVMLTDRQATRQQILTALNAHLIEQAQSGDVVLLHFSGYGSQVQLGPNAAELQRSLVPIDGRLPTLEQPETNDLLQNDLRQLLRSLKTDQLTTVLDVGYRPPVALRWGTLRSRARPSPLVVSPALSAATAGPELGWPGLLLRAASSAQPALEADWAGFTAGLFTYALTKTLWEMLPAASLTVVFGQAQTQMQRWGGPAQTAELTGKRRSESGLLPYNLTVARPAAGGTVTGHSADGRTVSLWLGGLSPDLLLYLQPGSSLVAPRPAASLAAPPLEPAAVELILQSRSGLTAAARLVATELPPAVATPIYEQVRRLPRHLPLEVALDATLARVERVDATSALASMAIVTVAIAGQPADVLFGHSPKQPGGAPVTADQADTTESVELGLQHYGLFDANRSPILETFSAKGEAVKTAVNRLGPRLQALQARKLLRLTVNPDASQLAVSVVLETTAPDARQLAQQTTRRPASALPKSRLSQTVTEGSDLELEPGSRLRYRLRNDSSWPLYLMLIIIDSRGRLLALAPEPAVNQAINETATEDSDRAAASRLEPSQSRSLPSASSDWNVPTATWVETFVLLSRAPFTQTQAVLADATNEATQPGLLQISQAVPLAEAVLSDLEAAVAEQSPLTADQYSLHMAYWAGFNLYYRVRSPASLTP